MELRERHRRAAPQAGASPRDETMTDPHSSAIDQILEAARSAAEERATPRRALERAGRVRAPRSTPTVNALGAEIAVEFAAKNGLATPSSGRSSPIGAALALRAAVEGLPELRSRASAPVAVAPPPPPSAPVASAPAAAPPPVEPAAPPPPKRTIVTTTAGNSGGRPPARGARRCSARNRGAAISDPAHRGAHPRR